MSASLRESAAKISILTVILFVFVIAFSGCWGDDEVVEYELLVAVEGEGKVFVEGVEDDYTITTSREFIFEENAAAQLEARAEDGWEFSEWQGDVDALTDETSDDIDVNMNEDVSLQAVFVKDEPEEKVVTGVENIEDIEVEKNTAFSELYEYGLPRNVEVTLDDDSSELIGVNWLEEDYDGSETGHYELRGQLVVEEEEYINNPRGKEANVVVEVREEPQNTLTIEIEGEGNTEPEADEHEFNQDEVIDLLAEPAPGWNFARWEGEVGDRFSAETTIKLDYDKAVTAVFVEGDTYTLNLEYDEEKGNIEPGSGEYLENETITLEVEPAAGWQFDGWFGPDTDALKEITENKYELTIDDDKNIEASFEREWPKLDIDVEGEGETVPEEGEHLFPSGFESIEANPAEGWIFQEWAGPDRENISSPESESTRIILEAEEEIEIRAIFAKPTLNIDVEGEGTVDPDVGEHTFEGVRKVDIEASPDRGWQFSHWQTEGPVLDRESPETEFDLDGNYDLTAVFEEKDKLEIKDEFKYIDVTLGHRLTGGLKIENFAEAERMVFPENVVLDPEEEKNYLELEPAESDYIEKKNNGDHL